MVSIALCTGWYVHSYYYVDTALNVGKVEQSFFQNASKRTNLFQAKIVVKSTVL
jgi:hypothetical protein